MVGVPKPKIGKKKKTKKKSLKKLRQELDLRCRELVFKRDGNKCRICGKTEYLAAHHIHTKKAYPGGRWILDNLITVCRGCHLNAHLKPEEFRQMLMRQFDRGWSWYELFDRIQEYKGFRACDYEDIMRGLV